MSNSVNKVILVGNLCANPEVRAAGGGRVANMRIATSESWRDKSSGEKREKAEFHNVTVWNEGLVGVCEKYLRKGSRVYIDGSLQTRKWKDQNGNDRYTTEVVLSGFGGALVILDGWKDDGAPRHNTEERQDDRGALDDDIPFD